VVHSISVTRDHTEDTPPRGTVTELLLHLYASWLFRERPLLDVVAAVVPPNILGDRARLHRLMTAGRDEVPVNLTGGRLHQASPRRLLRLKHKALELEAERVGVNVCAELLLVFQRVQDR